MLDVNFDVHEDVQAGNRSDVDRHKAGMAIMDQQISFQCSCTVIVHTASPVCDISQNEYVLCASKAACTMLLLSLLLSAQRHIADCCVFCFVEKL